MRERKDIYAQPTLEFVTVAIGYCQLLEQAEGLSLHEFVRKILRIAPLLYVKAQFLPEVEDKDNLLPIAQVSEEDYNFVQANVRNLLQDDDEFLEVICPEDLQTEETKWQCVSELLADVYQPVRNFLAIYQDGLASNMYAALCQIEQEFIEYWGQALLDALRTMHRIGVRYATEADEAYDD